jgi:caffeoylshikimate esterase
VRVEVAAMAASAGGGPPEVRQNYWGNMPEEEFYASNGVRNSKAFVKTKEGTLFTQEFLPAGEGVKPRGIVCLVHGYTSDTGWMFQSICLEMVKWGYAAFAADMLGHGRSDGLHGYVPSVDKVGALTSLVYSRHIQKSALTFARLWKLQYNVTVLKSGCSYTQS